MTEVRGVFGTGGCARGVMPLAREAFPGVQHVFVSDEPDGDDCNGHDVLDWSSFVALPDRRIVIAIAAPDIRRMIVARAQEAKVKFFDVFAADFIMMDNCSIGEGSIFSPRTLVTSNIVIGHHFHCNIGSYVEHDCRIGNHVTFAPGVKCNGAVTIGDGVYVGAGATIRQGVSIGAGAVIGMGAVVVKDVAADVTVVGNPALPMSR